MLSLVLLGSGLGAWSAGPAQGAGECELPPGVLTVKQLQLPVQTNAVACDALGRVVEHQGVRVRIPSPGHSVTGEALYPDGAESLYIRTDPDGTLTIETDDELEVLPGGSPSGSPAPCNDSAYNLNDKRWEEEYPGEVEMRWYWGDGPQPGGGSDADVVAELKDAMAAIETSKNDCSMADQVSADAVYAGLTDFESEIDNGDGTWECEWDTFTDGRSVVDAGNLDDAGNPPVAGACTWAQAETGYDDIDESDVRFNTTDFDFTYTPATNCSYDFDLQSVATHEFGHTFGLGHVGEADHGKLTMSTLIEPCNNSARTLGRGDVLGLRDYY